MTATQPPDPVPAPRRPRRARVFGLGVVVTLALLVVGYAVKVVATGQIYFDVGVDNREPDWVKLTAVDDASILVFADGRRFRVVPRTVAATAQTLDDLFEYEVSMGEIYAELEPAPAAEDGLQIVLHGMWARCGNSYMSPNPFARVPHYRQRASFAVEPVTSE